MRKEGNKRTWLAMVSLEIPELDEDHQRLLGHVDALIDTVASKTTGRVQLALNRLWFETEAHFAREEALMAEAQYPRLNQHCATHRRLLRELWTLGVALDASRRLRLPLVPMNYIGRRFVEHVAVEDRMVAYHLNEIEEKFLIGLA